MAGSVRDLQTNAAIGGALITIGNAAATTDPDGAYSLSVPVGEHQVMTPPGALRAAAFRAPPLAQRRCPPRLPRPGQLGDQPAQVVTGDPGEGRMSQGRTSP